MGAVDPWDTHLESATAALERLTSGSRSGRLLIREPGGWQAEIRGAKQTVRVQISSQAGQARALRLDDYRLVVAYGLGYHPPPGDSQAGTFTKQLSLHEGYHWDEQTLREIVLEVLGLLRHVMGVPPDAALAVEDASRQASTLAFSRGTLPRRKR